MGVKKLQTYMETCIGPEGFREVSLSELKAQYEKENPGAPVEILLDLECCLRFIYTENNTEFRYGGENVTLLKQLRIFFERFNRLGFKLISFYGNYTSRKKRTEWVRRRYETVEKVQHIIKLTDRNQFHNHSFQDLFVIPPGLCFTSTAIIKNVLNEKVIQSLTENDIEIITYAKKNKSFAIMSQDTDFIIANAAQYYLSAKHLNLETMKTYLYDGQVLARVHDLSLKQLPLFATILGTDLIIPDVLRSYHSSFFKKKNGKVDLDYFFQQVANQCRNVECDDNCNPCETDLVRIIRTIRSRGCNFQFEELYHMMLASIHSFNDYQVEDELYLHKIKDDQTKKTLKMALLLYRQCWITSDLLMLICSKTTEMSTCMEIFHPSVKPVGKILRNLRAVLYSATFNGNTHAQVEEFVMTGEGCMDRVPLVRAARLAYVRPLLDVWTDSLEPDQPRPGDYEASLDPQLVLDNVVYKTQEPERNKCKEYFVDLFFQSCRGSPELKKKLLATFIEGLPPAVQLPVFIFIYLEGDRHAYLHPSERGAVLFTFSLVAVLSEQQVGQFSHPRLKPGVDRVPLMRAANLFRRAAQVMINFNAVCGFPIPVEYLDGHNFWEGKFVQLFHNFLYDSGDEMQLYETIIEALQNFSDEDLIARYSQLMRTLAELQLLGMDLAVKLNSQVQVTEPQLMDS